MTQRFEDWGLDFDLDRDLKPGTQAMPEKPIVYRWRWIGDSLPGGKVHLDHSYLYLVNPNADEDGYKVIRVNCPVESTYVGYFRNFRKWLYYELKKEKVPFMERAFTNLSIFV